MDCNKLSRWGFKIKAGWQSNHSHITNIHFAHYVCINIKLFHIASIYITSNVQGKHQMHCCNNLNSISDTV